MIGAVDAGRVVDGVGVDVTAAGAELDSSQSSDAEVAALPDHLDPQILTVDTHGVVALVANLRIGLGRRFDVCTDSAVPQQIHRCRQNRLHQFRRRELRDPLGQTQCDPDAFGDRNRLDRAVPDAATFTDQALVVVGP